MAQVIQDNNDLGSILGGSLGQGLGGALQILAQNKVQNILQRQQASRVAPGLSALGIPHKEAQQIAMLPEQLQSLVLKNYLQGAESSGLDQALRQLAGEEPQAQGELSLGMLQQGQPQEQKLGALATPQEIAANIKNPKAEPKTEQAATKFQDILKNPRLSPEHRLKVAALQQQKQFHKEKLNSQEQREVDKETKPFYDEIAKGAKASKESDMRLDRMEQLIHRGNLTKPGWAALVDTFKHGVFGLGIDLGWALHPDTQEFQKLSTDFIKNAKDYFGARLTDTDLKAFLQTIPNATQTNQAKLRVISNLRSFNEIARLKKKAADDIIRKNGGKRPANFDSLVDEVTSPEVDKISEKFKKNLNEDALGVV